MQTFGDRLNRRTAGRRCAGSPSIRRRYLFPHNTGGDLNRRRADDDYVPPVAMKSVVVWQFGWSRAMAVKSTLPPLSVASLVFSLRVECLLGSLVTRIVVCLRTISRCRLDNRFMPRCSSPENVRFAMQRGIDFVPLSVIARTDLRHRGVDRPPSTMSNSRLDSSR